MAQKVTIGGDRVGSGKKMKAELHNYFRSTHNLSEDWASSMGSGILYPCLCKLGLRGDSFDISADMDARTIPTKGPLFGSYKMQLDIYECPVRLYQGILHNNPLAIGLKMNQVKFPMIEVSTKSYEKQWDAGKFNDSCLLKYLGMSGIGQSTDLTQETTITRQILALPALAYYDIFKQYYANKQEKKAYVIGGEVIYRYIGVVAGETLQYHVVRSGGDELFFNETTDNDIEVDNPSTNDINYLRFDFVDFDKMMNNLDDENYNDLYTKKFIEINYTLSGVTTNKKYSIEDLADEGWLINNNKFKIELNGQTGDKLTVKITYLVEFDAVTLNINENSQSTPNGSKLNIIPFDLDNIDNMRYDLLSSNRLGQTFVIGDSQEGEYLPYNILYGVDDNDVTLNRMPLNGLVLKTYQNDIFNNWLNSEWIEGENGINELTKVQIVEGAFSMDALNFAQKLYNMLNRVAVAGATYEDWQDVVYESIQRRQVESPIYLGGMSKEVCFDEIVQTAPQGEGDNRTELGTLGGRGSARDNTAKGGRIHVKCEEACFIIGIISLTPRQYNTQGNEFYMTEVQTMDDLHKPGMDGIGFQDLIGERMAYWDTRLNGSTITHRSKIGKLPAWIDYMTSYNRAYGDFAAEGGKGFMILNRNYEYDEQTHGIKDATTYVDPAKYNYAFAYNELDAQNFWVKVAFNIKARRLMSARLIPNV